MASRMALASATMIGKTRRNTAGGMVTQPGKRRSRSAEVNVDGVRVSKPNVKRPGFSSASFTPLC